MSNTRLLSNTNDNVHVDLPSGKISKNGQDKPLKKQSGMTCLIFALRRIAFFNTPADSLEMKAYKSIKQRMTYFNGDMDMLVKFGNEVCKALSINLDKALLSNQNFLHKHEYLKARYLNVQSSPLDYYKNASSKKQWLILYDVLVENVLCPVMNVKQVSWQPSDGVFALKNSLRQNGAHFFIGKFGSCFYSTKPEPFLSETTPNRNVFTFNKNSYHGEAIPYTHSIIVDQIKMVKGKEMVFFRDPNQPSKKDQPESIYMLGFTTFTERLRNRQGAIAQKNSQYPSNFAMVSSCPEKLYRSS